MLPKLSLSDTIRNIIITLFFAAVVGVLFVTSSRHGEVSSVIIGFSPINYTYLKLEPLFFSGGFPNNVQIYDASAPMRLYLFSKQLLNIEPEKTALAIILLQATLITLGIFHLARSLGADIQTAMVILAMLVVSNLPGVNLARLGDGLQNQIQSLYYGFGQGFRLLAISYFLRSKHLFGVIFLGLTIVSHLTMGLAAIVFLGAYYLVRVREAFSKKLLIPVIFVSVACLFFFLSVFSGLNIGSDGISKEDFIRATRSFSFHWHPITLGLFGNSIANVFWPLIFTSLLFLIGLSGRSIAEPVSQRLVLGFIAVFLVSALGVFFSDIWPFVIFVKLSLQRSTEIVSLLGVMLAIIASIRLIKKGAWWEAIISAVALAALLSPTKRDMAFLAWAGVMFCFLTRGWLGPFKILPDELSIRRWSLILLVLLLPFLFLYLYDRGLFETLNRLPKTFQFNAIVIFIIMLFWRGKHLLSIKKRSSKTLFLAITALASIFFISDHRNDRLDRYLDKYGNTAEDMLQAQIWAKNNTAQGAVFLTDPSWQPGWRDYSQRPTFGHYRDWALFGFAYNSSQFWYQEGLRRMKLFGADPIELAKSLTDRGDSVWLTNKLIREVINENYNTRSIDSLVQLARDERVSFVVVKNDRFTGSRFGHAPVFSSKYFDIYEVGKAR